MSPAIGPIEGGTTVVLQANFDVLPYNSVRVRFRTPHGDSLVQV
jgi:hypothetical protein